MHPTPKIPAVYSVDEARSAVLEGLPQNKNTDQLPALDALGRVTAKDILARHAIPPFRNSAMDGYAIRFKDFKPGQAFKVIGTSLAGHPFKGEIPEHSAVKITTGAMLPETADTIVIQENTRRRDDTITVERTPKAYEFVRNIGDDIPLDSLLISSGTCITPAHAGLISAQGIRHIEVYRQPVIAVFSTGDELSEPGASLNEGSIYDSNRTTICALLKKAGFDAKDLGIVKDNEDKIRTLLRRMDGVDFVISSGGVSVGEADHMKSALEATGKLHFWKVAMKPGKPLVTGQLNKGAYYFGLPGNPVSSMVTCLQFVIPALRTFAGHQYTKPPEFRAKCQSRLQKEPGRFEYQRGVYSIDENGRPSVTTTGMQDSHMLHSMGVANCFICLAPSSTGAHPGDDVQIVLFDTLTGVAG